jgi:hypothetical protein
MQYTVNSTIKYNGKRHKPGCDPVAIDDSAAAVLLALKAISPVEKPKAVEPEGTITVESEIAPEVPDAPIATTKKKGGGKKAG